ncbi:MAG TPA: SMP-30/gluconolactonase/LRE family protein [Conexibacter sp.]|nr:SMP-30/gluconolactonase/LRE family protein [Conexibacter sp.]
MPTAHATTAMRTLARGLGFPEAPRWHDGRLWFSDMGLGAVFAVDLDGRLERIVEVAGRPGGLGWMPDGRLVVVSMRERRLLREDAPGSRRLVEVARLDDVAPFHCNDLLVDAAGRAYVGNFGFDLAAGDEPRATVLACVHPDGRTAVVADELLFPNGMALAPDGTLIVAESLGRRLTAFDVGDDGALAGRRSFAATPGLMPDGICLDAAGATWVACAATGAVARFGADGALLTQVASGFPHASACMLGGSRRRTLLVCVARTGDEEQAGVTREGAILALDDVDVPGAGLP